MNESPKKPSEGDRRFVAGFAVVIAPPEARLEWACPEPLESIPLADGEGSATVRAFGWGTRGETVDLAASPGTTVLVKGRPFSLRSASPLRLDAGSERAAFRDLDGRFSLGIVRCDGSAVFATDLIGAGALFYARHGAALWVCTHLGVLLRMLPDVPAPDWHGVASLAATWGMFGGRTPYEGVRRLMTCETLSASLDGRGGLRVAVERYGHPSELLVAEPDGYDEERATHRIGELVVEGVRRELECGARSESDHAAVMLSGGLDSRAILMGAIQSGHDSVGAYTFGSEGSRDLTRARALTAELGARHTAIPYEAWRIESYADLVLELGGGISGLQTSHLLAGFDWCGPRTDLAIVGYLGGAMTGSHVLQSAVGLDVDAAWQSNALSVVFHRLASGVANAIRPHFAAELEDLVAEAVSTWSEDLTGCSPCQKMLWLNWTVRQATWIAQTFDLADHLVPVSTPIYYRPLMSYCFHAPPGLLLYQRMYRRSVRGTQQRMARHRPPPATAPPPGAHERLDWAERVGKSRDWLTSRIEENAGPRLRPLLLDSLERPGKGIPDVLIMLPMCLVAPGRF